MQAQKTERAHTRSRPADQPTADRATADRATDRAADRAAEPGLFADEIAIDDCGYLRIRTLEATPHRTHRDGRNSEIGGPFVVVAVQASGSGLLSRNGSRIRLSQGDMALLPSGGELAVELPEPSRMHLLRLPCAVLAVPQADLSAVLGSVIRATPGLGSVVSRFLAAFAEAAPGLDAEAGGRTAGHIAGMLATLIAERAAAGTRPAAGTATTEAAVLMARIRAHISLHLADPDLSPRSIATAHHVSVRYLHRLFSQEATTVGNWIRERRLEEAARELARPGRSRTVSCIAHRWGFVSANHFSRVFRQRYGMSPRDWTNSFAPPRNPPPGGVPAGVSRCACAR
ncbi:helix-turn-helix domain-containing protein [Streptomyces erythrochromogenes]|uniref:helix-turn-helix domain-containing protein n=1 Tax=Streptomyces erythrochromogenes TaxID=285574 RepID=UPI00224E6A91|nr:helix-turn-helix domain-containing protein [Streptomyces erythrochromogenes]MCX5589487.1 helix-turn-helix domain-containing protein [Streptomyces erythrochromogenes]